MALLLSVWSGNTICLCFRLPKEKGFSVNSEKSAVGMEDVKCPGYIVGSGMVDPQSKVEAIQSWPYSLTKNQLSAFFGIVGQLCLILQPCQQC